MDVLKKCFQAVMDFIEIYMPMCWFILLFVAFILQIISRYIFNNPLVWPYELAQISYVWIITLGCCYAQRTDDNIVFSVIYFTRYSTVFKVPLGFVYLGFFVFQIITIVRYCGDLAGCYKEFRKGGKAV